VETTDSGDAGRGGTTDGGEGTTPKPKKPRKTQTAVVLGIIRQEFTRISESGFPLEPKE
jgi:hypothetical protein